MKKEKERHEYLAQSLHVPYQEETVEKEEQPERGWVEEAKSVKG
jgi:hypothetical protein